MKKCLSIVFAIFLLASCQQEQLPHEGIAGSDKLSATMEQLVMSRTSMDETNNVLWSEDDQIVAFFKTTRGQKYQVTSASVGRNTADFVKVTESESGDGLFSGMEIGHIVALYPYSSSVDCSMNGDDSYKLDFSLPQTQYYSESSFGNGAFPMLAVSSDNNMTFRNICGGLKLQFKGVDKIKSITLEGLGDELLSGSASVIGYVDGSAPEITMSSSAAKSVTLDCGDGVQLYEDQATTFIITLPPMTFKSGMKLTVTDTDGLSKTLTNSSSNTVKRSSLLTFPVITYKQDGVLEFPEGALTSYDIPMEGGTVEIPVMTNQEYEVVIPENSKDWITFLQTKALREDVITLNILANTMPEARSADVLVNVAGETLRVITISQEAYIRIPQEGDYIDEYGVNHGQGITVGETIWAPVNCGYHNEDFKYGKLYQWGRKYGQGYSAKYGEKQPSLVPAPVDMLSAQSLSDENVFYYSPDIFEVLDWSQHRKSNLWNAGTEENPVKTEYDPCPDGWRVPTKLEQEALLSNDYSWSNNVDGCSGILFSIGGESSKLFLPAAGIREDSGTLNEYEYENRFATGRYWSSALEQEVCGYRINFTISYLSIGYGYRTFGYSVRCVRDDNEVIPVESLVLNHETIDMNTRDSKTLSATVSPSNANNRSVLWWSDRPGVVTVDENGSIKAISAGAATITAMAGMQTATCKVTVSEGAGLGASYIDEYGSNHGGGTNIDGVVWAPVNCGYHYPKYQYGKLYQWGRKYGQGYVDPETWNEYEDPSSGESVIVVGPVSLSVGQAESNSNKFYTDQDESPYDWLVFRADDLWNAGTEDNPIKTEYDPCPAGWRVPTYSELCTLYRNYSSWDFGLSFSGSKEYSSYGTSVHFPAAGHLTTDGTPERRSVYGYYWSSQSYDVGAYCLYLYKLSSYSCGVSMGGVGHAAASSVRCVRNYGTLIPVESLTLNHTSLEMNVGASQSLSATIAPSDANHKKAYWWSDNTKVATVDSDGKVTVLSYGTATITAMAGMQTASCVITASDPSSPAPADGDYVDEYGINHGQGVEIDGVIWAPVNCGYHQSDFKYGKLYQWGRRYGHGYNGDMYNFSGSSNGVYTDAAEPEIAAGPVSLASGEAEKNSNVFYTGDAWLSSSNKELWNEGFESYPMKTQYDPCPSGWRVPTEKELDALAGHYSSWAKNEAGQAGRWYSGSNEYSAAVPRVFLPAAGLINKNGSAHNRGLYSYYWSSRNYDNTYCCCLVFSSIAVNTDWKNETSNGMSVRCVLE